MEMGDVFEAKLEMIDDFLESIQDHCFSLGVPEDAQRTMSVALLLSRISGSAALAGENLLASLDRNYDYVAIGEDPPLVPSLPAWIQEAIGEEAKKHGREPGAEALGILKDIFKDRKPEAEKKTA